MKKLIILLVLFITNTIFAYSLYWKKFVKEGDNNSLLSAEIAENTNYTEVLDFKVQIQL